MKFGRDLKNINGLNEKEAIRVVAEHLIYLQRELEKVLTQLEKESKG